ncbi:hypothetical protein [Streptomyces gilvus]|uniref:hypothetical protein n=1 Tax=Streptomyces gilvus TaxID=2920937 RepID=UPI001F0F83B5|nr:hypothetical protein [Streptomyces sp. CME 23]MCH5676778.1 hypothetical protein [Streptomyces sp. CME 23]
MTGALALGVLVTATATLGAPALAAQEAPPGRAGLEVSDTRTVTLVTGDQVTVTTRSGKPSVLAVRPASRTAGNGAFLSFQDGSGDRYVIPAAAQPYVGRQLDLSLFDVTALAKGTQAGRVPVTVSYARGAKPSTPTGLTLTSTSGASARGYTTAASGRKLARLLKQRIAADVKAGHQPGSTPLFPGVASLGRTGAGTESATAGSGASAKYKLNILRITAEDRSGAGVNGQVLVTNTDDATMMTAVLPVDDGIEKVAVPSGHYSLAAPVVDFDASGNVTAQSLVTLTDLDVTGATSTDLDARTATAQVTAATPRPATADYAAATWGRTDVANGSIDWAPTASAVSTDTTPVYVNPQPAATTGKVAYYTQWSGHGPATGDPYRYDLAGRLTDEVAADQRIKVTGKQLATVRERYARDPAASPDGIITSGELGPGLPAAFSAAVPQTMPARVTDYLSGNNGGVWIQQSFPGKSLAFTSGDRPFTAGRTYTQDWARGPVGLGLGQYTNGPYGGSECSACVADGNLLAFLATTDSEADHAGGPSVYDEQPAAFGAQLYRDGTLIDDRTNDSGVFADGQTAPDAHYRLVADQDFSGDATLSQSTTARTELTFGLPSASDTDSLLPDPFTCEGQSAATPCRVLPLLTARLDLAADDLNTSHRTTQSMGLDISHVTFGGAGSRAAITSAAVEVSFDGGKTWQKTALHGSKGHYRARWTNPASARGTSPALRVTAADADGNGLTETITHAYSVAATTS